jgi:prevent-host-death family protein
MQAWQLQDAKNRCSEVVKRAREEVPQYVTVHGRPAAVVVSALAFEALIKPQLSFPDLLLSDTVGIDAWPDDVVDAINDRSGGTCREIGP